MITRTVEGHQSEIYGLEFSNDEKYLSSVSKDGAVYIWSCANYKQVARIDNVYTKSEIPVYFTADSLHIIIMEHSASFRISDLQGQKVADINTGRKVIAIRPLSDPDRIAVLNDKNLQNELRAKGFENVKRFSWELSAKQIIEIMEKLK